MLEVCRDKFQELQEEEDKQKGHQDLEAFLKFQDRFFGNTEFIGELYRRELLPLDTIILVFQELLGMEDMVETEMKLEGAINLMNKVGKELESRINQLKEKDTKKK